MGGGLEGSREELEDGGDMGAVALDLIFAS